MRLTKNVQVKNPKCSNNNLINTVVNHHRKSTQKKTLGIRHGKVTTQTDKTAVAITLAAGATGAAATAATPSIWSGVQTLWFMAKAQFTK